MFSDINRFKYMCNCNAVKSVHHIYDSLGRAMFAYQCHECLSRLGDFIPHSYTSELKKSEPWLGGGNRTFLPIRLYRNSRVL